MAPALCSASVRNFRKSLHCTGPVCAGAAPGAAARAPAANNTARLRFMMKSFVQSFSRLSEH
jgi:hypothetical protein